MFYIVVFALLAVLLIVAAFTVFSRNRAQLRGQQNRSGTSNATRRARKAQRSQSRNARRKRH